MSGFVHAPKEERLSNVRANLARVYHPEPLKLSEWMKAQIRSLKAQARTDDPNPKSKRR